MTNQTEINNQIINQIYVGNIIYEFIESYKGNRINKNKIELIKLSGTSFIKIKSNNAIYYFNKKNNDFLYEPDYFRKDKPIIEFDKTILIKRVVKKYLEKIDDYTKEILNYADLINKLHHKIWNAKEVSKKRQDIIKLGDTIYLKQIDTCGEYYSDNPIYEHSIVNIAQFKDGEILIYDKDDREYVFIENKNIFLNYKDGKNYIIELDKEIFDKKVAEYYIKRFRKKISELEIKRTLCWNEIHKINYNQE